MSERAIRLSEAGSDRATGYVMSSKIVRRDGKLLCTWLDRARYNHWAVVDPATGRLEEQGWLDPPGVDNHCGAALAVDGDGTAHLVSGGHHSPFRYYRLGGDDRWGAWQQAAQLDDGGTYPSLVADGDGTLHLAYRVQGERWMLLYRRRPRGGAWSTPRVLVRAAKPGYVYWTNALALGPEGRLHLVLGNARQRGDGAIYYGASHLYSDDSGGTWRQLGVAGAVPDGVSAWELALIEGAGCDPERVQSAQEVVAGSAPGPLNYNYGNMLLSNPVIDAGGAPSAIVHNVLRGDAALQRWEGGRWQGQSLLPVVQSLLPGYRIHAQSALSRCADGRLVALLMVAPADVPGWGPNGTTLLRVVCTLGGSVLESEMAAPPDPGVASWLPSIEQWTWVSPLDEPAWMHTRGVNAGGFADNVNAVQTEVWLRLPGDLRQIG